MKKKILCFALSLAIAIGSSGCDLVFTNAPESTSSRSSESSEKFVSSSSDADYNQYVDDFASKETEGKYDSDLPYAFSVDENMYDLENIVTFQILDFIEKDSTFVYSFQVPYKNNKNRLASRVMAYNFETGAVKTLFAQESDSGAAALEVLDDQENAKDLGDSVTVGGEQSMFAYKLPYDEAYFVYFGGIARYYKLDGTCYRTVNLSGSYQAALQKKKPKGNSISDVQPMYIDGMESIVLTASFTDYDDRALSDDANDEDEEKLSSQTHGVVFIYQIANLRGANFWKIWDYNDSGNGVILTASSIAVSGYGSINAVPYASGNAIVWLGNVGDSLPQNSYLPDPGSDRKCRSVDKKLWLYGSISNVITKLYYKTVKDKDGKETQEPDFYYRRYDLSSDSFLLLCNYIYDCDLGFETVNETETLCFNDRTAYWLPDNGSLSWGDSSFYTGSAGQIKEDRFLKVNLFSKTYHSDKDEAIQSAGEIPNGFVLFSSDHIYLTFFHNMNFLGEKQLDYLQTIDLKKMNFATYQPPEIQASSGSSKIEYNWGSSNSTHSMNMEEYLIPQSEDNPVEITDDAPNPDSYNKDSMLVFGKSDYLFTGLSNGIIRFQGDKAKQILKAALFRTWRLSDGSYLSVGFDTGKERYVISDLPRARIVRFKL